MNNIGIIKLPENIDRIELLFINLPFVKPFSISSYTWYAKEALLVKAISGDITGWGECVADPDPFYSPETTISAKYIIEKFIIPYIKPGMPFGELFAMFNHIRGNQMAKAAVENALIDLSSRIHKQPLHEFLGYPSKKIMSGISIGLQDSIDELLDAVQEAVDKKYHRVKMKIKKGKDVEWVKAVRDAFPNIKLMADANGDYDLGDAERLRKLDAFDLMMIEQPLSYSDIYLHSKLQKSLATPLCLDESIHTMDDAKMAVELGACKIINIKQGRVGGMVAACEMAEYCHQHGVEVWSGGMDESGIGRAFNIHLQTAEGFSIPGDTSETTRYFAEDVVAPSVILDKEGYIQIPEGYGTGITTLEERIRKYKIG